MEPEDDEVLSDEEMEELEISCDFWDDVEMKERYYSAMEFLEGDEEDESLD